MNKAYLVVFVLLLISGATLAAVYKWVDQSGRVHYGDSPPQGSDAELVAVPKGPSQMEVERARQQAQQKIERYEKFSEEVSPSEPLEKSSQEADSRVVTPDHLVCNSPLSDLVRGPSAETYTPISPTSLTKAQQKSLDILFDKAEASWQGAIVELTCLDGSSEPRSRMTNFEAQATVDWNARRSQLLIDTDSVGKESGIRKRVTQIFEVGDALYFSDTKSADFIKTADTIARDGNEVEVLTLDRKKVSFLIIRRIPTDTHTRIPRAEVRQLEISGRTLKLIELYYQNKMLAGSRTCILNR